MYKFSHPNAIKGFYKQGCKHKNKNNKNPDTQSPLAPTNMGPGASLAEEGGKMLFLLQLLCCHLLLLLPSAFLLEASTHSLAPSLM